MWRLVEGRWEGCWVLAIMMCGEMDQFPKDYVDFRGWRLSWETNEGMLELRREAERFVDAVERGRSFKLRLV